MRFKAVLLAGAMIALAVGPLHAQSCDDLVIDSAKVFTDVGKVTAAAKALAATGYDVRVRTFKDLEGATSLDAFEKKYRQKCPSWLSGGLLRSRMFLLMYDDKTGSLGPYFNPVLDPKKDEIYKVIRATVVKGWHAYHDRGEKAALGEGFVSGLHDLREVFTRGSGAQAPAIVVHQEAANNSWVVSVVAVIVFAALLGLGAIFYFRRRDEGGDIQAAQQRARRAYADCVSRIETISNEKFISARAFNLEAAEGVLSKNVTAAFRSNLEQVQGYAKSARTALATFVPDTQRDPNPNGLSAEAYFSNESACTDMIAHFVEPAEKLVEQIDKATAEAHKSNAA